MSDDPSYWLDHFNGDSELAALLTGSMTRRPCPWCGRGLRPCNLQRHIDAAHFKQLTIDDIVNPPQTAKAP